MKDTKNNYIKACYIHIPFCKDICFYCDFCKMYYEKKWVASYLEALDNEIKSVYQHEELNSLYVGGGTPSCLNEKELEKFFDIIKIFKLEKNYEFTFECNVNDICEELLILLKKNRVNRLSIGIQTFNKTFLKEINRRNDHVSEKIDLCKKYFKSINVDLMYGFHNQTIKELKEDLNLFLKLDVSHISTYCLILEENTKLKIDNYEELDSDSEREMFDLIRHILKDFGFIHYELSNFAKKGCYSTHNLTYWNNERYYGFGLGASSYIDNIRYTNTKSLNNYLKKEYIFEKEVISRKIDMENEMILGLRKIKGVSKKKFYSKFGVNIKDVFDTKMLNENKNYFYIPSKYLYVSNSILIDFINSI